MQYHTSCNAKTQKNVNLKKYLILKILIIMIMHKLLCLVSKWNNFKFQWNNVKYLDAFCMVRYLMFINQILNGIMSI